MNSQQQIRQHQFDVLNESRRTPRFDISVQGRYRTGNGIAQHVPIFEISETGCRFYDRFGRLTAGVEMSLKIESIGPILATVRWCKDHIAGIEFAYPIYGPVFDFIRHKLAHQDED